MVNSIPAKELVDVIPNVLNAGGSALDLNGLLLTNSIRVPINTVQTFATAADVADFFGGSSQEADNATVYFNGFDNSNVKPGSVLFTQYNAVDVAAYLRSGDIGAQYTLDELKALASGNVTISIDGYSRTGSAIDLSAASSYSNAASIIQTALNLTLPTLFSVTGSIAGTTLTVTAVGSGNVSVGASVTGNSAIGYVTEFLSGTGGTGTYKMSATQTVSSATLVGKPTAAAVAYDSVSGAFTIASGIVGDISTIGFATGTMSAPLLLTSATGATLSQGADASSPDTFMDNILELTQNWATFMTLFDPDVSGFTNKQAFADWANGQENRFMYVCWDTDQSPRTSNPATGSLGFALQQADTSGTYLISSLTTDTTTGPEMAAFACGIAASLDFNQTNGRTTFAYRSQTGLVPSVTSASQASNLVANGYNFYGAYATANQRFIFMQDGQVSGPFEWADSYIDQIWLNNQFQLALMELLANARSIPYNPAGYSMIETACADVINQAGNFGIFRPGVTLSQSQRAAVNNAAGVNIADTLQTRGWFLQVKDASPQVRAARGSPPCTFWYVDGQSVQKITLASIEVQ